MDADNLTIVESRRKSAMELMHLLARNAKMAFVDECSIKSQQGKMKTWMRNSRDLVLP